MITPSTLAPFAYTLLRVVAGFLFFCHGLQKLGFLGGREVELTSLVGAAAIIELAGGLLLMVGLFTRLAAFVTSGEMAFAYFLAHQPRGALPIQNGGEAAALFCFLFLYMAARGPGVLSLDRLRGRGV
jgi:putative oxidoreductase